MIVCIEGKTELLPRVIAEKIRRTRSIHRRPRQEIPQTKSMKMIRMRF